MPRTLTVRFECDRCGRQWFVDYKEGEKMPEAAALKLTLKSNDGVVTDIEFQVMCQTCMKSVSNYVASIGKELRGMSPERREKEAGAKQDAPKKGASAKAH